jgi:hypothetical protein
MNWTRVEVPRGVDACRGTAQVVVDFDRPSLVCADASGHKAETARRATASGEDGVALDGVLPPVLLVDHDRVRS